jgi:hypothetical protein
MTPDLVDEMFGGEEEYYPGSKRKIERQPVASNVEFVSDPWREDFTTKMVNGEEMKMYPIGALANALGVSVQTIRYWTNKGYLPMAPYRLPSNMVVRGEKVAGRRLYTEAIIEATVEVFEKHGVLGALRINWADKPDLRIEVVEAWQKILNTPTTK